MNSVTSEWVRSFHDRWRAARFNKFLKSLFDLNGLIRKKFEKLMNGSIGEVVSEHIECANQEAA